MAAALAALGIVGTAQAKLTGNYAKFAQCPYPNLEVKKCILSVTESGEVVLGSKTVPIVNPVTLQGGYGAATEEKEEAFFSKFYEATNKITLRRLLDQPDHLEPDLGHDQTAIINAASGLPAAAGKNTAENP